MNCEEHGATRWKYEGMSQNTGHLSIPKVRFTPACNKTKPPGVLPYIQLLHQLQGHQPGMPSRNRCLRSPGWQLTECFFTHCSH
ncbi:hypothetical protein H671_2g5669 [Cricetulus griseus]|uniref:Uncharacterized protein n=1 Tax=Cricetulus griseus TaxID=10029 RepID=A0A061IF56_CRIGR|nr:hypothetical protein H671_2g5669 [Cricetulus griseus]